MNKYFAGIKTVEELRKKYKELLKKHHPDNGGNEETMKEINRQYDALYAILKEKECADDTHTNYEENERFKAVLSEIIRYNMTIEVIGSWLWCTDCYAYRNQLKVLGFRWCSRKKAWAWHSEPYRKYHSREMSLDSIRQKYGSDVINRKTKQTAIS